MIALNRRTKIFVSKEPTDMRASYDSLFSRVKGTLEKDPYSGHLFLFINGGRTSCKCMYYDGTGFVIISKRMDKGTFSKINPMFRGEIVLTGAEFGLFFEGANLEISRSSYGRKILQRSSHLYYLSTELLEPDRRI